MCNVELIIDLIVILKFESSWRVKRASKLRSTFMPQWIGTLYHPWAQGLFTCMPNVYSYLAFYRGGLFDQVSVHVIHTCLMTLIMCYFFWINKINLRNVQSSAI